MPYSQTTEDVDDKGVTVSTLKLSNIQASMEGKYECKPRYGSFELKGNPATLTVLSKFPFFF